MSCMEEDKKEHSATPSRNGRKPLPPDFQAIVDASLKRNEEALRRLAKL